LFGVAVRRARGLGRGGDLAKYLSPGVSEVSSPLATVKTYIDDKLVKMHVLIPELADVYGALGELKKLGSRLHRMLEAEGRKDATYKVNVESLPLELQMALIEAAWAATTVAMNMRQSKDVREWIAPLLTTCDPRAAKVEVSVNTQQKETVYYIFYSCKSHMNDELEMWVRLKKYRDKPGIYLELLP
jgi:hypothetical protein